MNKDIFLEEITKLGIKYNDTKLELLENYYNLLIDYNKHTNITRIVEKEDAYLKHFYDSLTIVKVIDLNNVTNLLDIGSGAGLPGIVLKMFYPHLSVTLLDSNNKKTKFLSLVNEKLKLNITIVNDRAENYVKKTINSFELVTARAVANLRILTEISIPFIKENGYFIAMKANINEELIEAKQTIDVLSLTLEEKEIFNLYNNSGERTLLKFKKTKKSNLKDIRSYDKILKKSL